MLKKVAIKASDINFVLDMFDEVAKKHDFSQFAYALTVVATRQIMVSSAPDKEAYMAHCENLWDVGSKVE